MEVVVAPELQSQVVALHEQAWGSGEGRGEGKGAARAVS